MRLDDFSKALPELWDGEPGAAVNPRDRRFSKLLADVGGQSVENTLAVLNLAAQYLEPGEVYLEAGAFRGVSICAAALGNDRGHFITVDNFSQFGGPEAECRSNIDRWTEGNVELVDASIWDYLPRLTAPVGVWFYDARHRWWDQWRALEEIEPFLADEALIIVDDASWPEVGTADRAFVDNHPRFEFAARFPSDGMNGPRWWNGVDVITYRRVRPPASPRVLRRARWGPMVTYGIGWHAITLSRHYIKYSPAIAKNVAKKILRRL